MAAFAGQRISRVLALLAVLCVPQAGGGEVFERVVSELSVRFYDEAARERIPELAQGLRELAGRAPLADRELVDRLLAELDASHLALFSRASYERMRAELADRRLATFGMQLVDLGGLFFADWISEGGPAERAGVLRGDLVLAIDGEPPALSRRLDWSTDDAALPDPPIHGLLGRTGERIELELEGSGGRRRRVGFPAEPWSATDAARASARRFDLGQGRQAGYVHFWFIADRVPSRVLAELLAGKFSDCAALLLDLRGRGGHASEVDRLLRLLHPQRGPWRRPVLLLTDRGTRSAKEVIAQRLREQGGTIQIGERTAGAVIPASFADVGANAVLMYPARTLGKWTALLEGRGVAPDVEVTAPLPFADGRDPILEAALVAARVWCGE